MRSAGIDTAMMMITHDLGVVAEMADDVAVMYAGKVVEAGATEAVLNEPDHPYTMGLYNAFPALERSQRRLTHGNVLIRAAGADADTANKVRAHVDRHTTSQPGNLSFGCRSDVGAHSLGDRSTGRADRGSRAGL